LGLFGWQNLQTRVDLVLNLGPIGGWYLARAFPVPYLMGIMFGSGFLIAAAWLGGRAMTAGRRVKAAERQVAALQDEVQWGKRGGSTSAAPKPAPRAPVAPAKVAVPAAPSKPADKPKPSDPPDFDDLI
jgi:hypothetical protein